MLFCHISHFDLLKTCLVILFGFQARLDEYPRQMRRDISVIVNRARGEGVDKIIKLKKRYGCTKDNDGLALTQLKVRKVFMCRQLKRAEVLKMICELYHFHTCYLKKEDVHELKLENSRLTALLCKLKALRCWRKVVDQEKLHRQLLQTKQVSSRMKKYSAIRN